MHSINAPVSCMQHYQLFFCDIMEKSSCCGDSKGIVGLKPVIPVLLHKRLTILHKALWPI